MADTHYNSSLTSPTGQTVIPVCIGDLPSYDYHADLDTVTMEVVQMLRDHPELPGVMLFDDGELVSVIPRQHLFERLGQMYGVELFIRKPVQILLENLRMEAFSLPDHLRVNDAVQQALNRPAQSVYDPVVIVSDERKLRLMDMHTLLLVQSQLLENLNNVMTSLDRVNRTLNRRANLIEALNDTLDTLGKIVPYHRAILMLVKDNGLRLLVGRGYFYNPDKLETDTNIPRSPIYKTMLRTRKAIVVEDVDVIPKWEEHMAGLGPTRCWMGLPLLDNSEPVGMLSLSRTSRSPFLKEEKDIAEAFAEQISAALEKSRFYFDLKPFRKKKVQRPKTDYSTLLEEIHLGRLLESF
jgi:hypothetical protein